jgi:hypothetical protein
VKDVAPQIRRVGLEWEPWERVVGGILTRGRRERGEV